jgi:hypothetical protein
MRDLLPHAGKHLAACGRRVRWSVDKALGLWLAVDAGLGFIKGVAMIGLRVAFLVLVCPLLVVAQASHTICDVQEYDSNGLSPLVSQSVTVRGAVTMCPGHLVPLYTMFHIEADGCGVRCFSFETFPVELALGDSLEVEGVVEEYITATAGATTEIVVTSFSDVTVISTGNPEPQPVDMDIAGIQVEDNEGRLLRTTGMVADTDGYTFMDITDGVATLRVNRSYNDSVSFAAYEVGDTLRVTGILAQYDLTSPYLEGYELIPRLQRDIEPWHSTAVCPTSWGQIKALYRQ